MFAAKRLPTNSKLICYKGTSRITSSYPPESRKPSGLKVGVYRSVVVAAVVVVVLVVVVVIVVVVVLVAVSYTHLTLPTKA